MIRIFTGSRFEVGSGEADGETGTAGVSLASGTNSSVMGIHLISKNDVILMDHIFILQECNPLGIHLLGHNPLTRLSK